MTLFINIITIILCMGALIYCYILSRQLVHFRTMRQNISSLIEEMITTTNELNISFEQTKISLGRNYARLQDKIDEAAFLSEHMDQIMTEINQKTHDLQAINQTTRKLDTLFDNQNDPLEEVMPKGLGNPIRKPSSYIIPGEEYI